MDIEDAKFNAQFSSMDWNIKDSFKGKSLEEINSIQPKKGFSVAAVNTEKGLNVGTMMRTAVIFGADEFIVLGNKKYDKRSTVGAQNYIKVSKFNIQEGNQYIHDNYLRIFMDTDFPEFDAAAVKRLKFWSSSMKLRPCFIFGNEKDGIPPEMYNEWNFKFSIKQYGVLRSLNVAVAAGIVMEKYVNG